MNEIVNDIDYVLSELSDGNFTVKSNCTEQAGAVEELTASIVDVNAMSDDNAKGAEAAYQKAFETAG